MKRKGPPRSPSHKLWIFVSGWVTILVGIVFLPLPGPGTLIIFAGISMLAVEYRWARQLRILVWRKGRRALRATRSRRKRGVSKPTPDFNEAPNGESGDGQ